MRPAREITENGNSALPLRVDQLTDDPGEPARTLYCTDIEGTELRVAIQELPTDDLPWETGEWYQFDGIVPSRQLGVELVVPSGDGSVERIDAPERQTHLSLAELDDPWLIQLDASDEIIAVTVQPRPMDGTASIRAEVPGTYEIGAVCFAYCDGAGDTTVYHREEPGPQDEHLLLQHVVEDLSEAGGATLVTHGGDRQPLEMLHTRLKLAAEGDIIDAGAERVLDDCFHANMESVAARAGAHTVRDAAQQLGIDVNPVLLSDYDSGSDPADWREDWESDTVSLSDVSNPRMTDRDYATLVERYLGDEDESAVSTELGRCLKAYASADLSLLCELGTSDATDQLGCPQLSERLLT